MAIKGENFGKSKTVRKGLDRALGHLREMDRESLHSVAERLCKERTTLEAILQSLQEAVIVIDRWGNIETINPSAQRLLAIPEEENEKNAILWRAVPELANILQVTSDGTSHLISAKTQELELHYPTPRIVQLFVSPIKDQDSILIVLSDVTAERIGATRQLEEARLTALTQLAAGVAHELGNPLNALQIHLQLIERALQKEKLSSKAEKIAQSLKISQDEVKRLDQIIRNFLQAIRPTPANLQPTDLMGVLEEVLTVLRAEMEGARINVSVKLPGILPMVMADSEQLKQVYFNLLKNAREAMTEGGTIYIRANADDENLKLHFIDSGCGIKEEDLTHLFEPYYTTKPGGTGLGMMIAKKIMRAHRGNISVESREGEGTTVTLSFPLKYRRFRPLSGPQNTPQLEG